MGLLSRREKQGPLPDIYGDDNKEAYPQTYPGGVGYGDEVPVGERYDADLHVQCPPHTTERKLMTKIDLRVIPCLCILYRKKCQVDCEAER